jgi:hypothetical protein
MRKSPEQNESTTADLTPDSSPAHRGQEWPSNLVIFLLALAAGVFVSLYVVWVRQMTVHQKFSNAVEQAAIVSADSLAKLTIQSPTFGPVGLCDLPAGPAAGQQSFRTVGLNTLYATLRLDAIIAYRLHNKVMMKLCREDLKQVRQLEKELIRKLNQAVEQKSLGAYSAVEGGSLYQQVFQALAVESRTGRRKLFSLKVMLGTLAGDNLPCLTPTPAQIDRGASYAKDGFYKPFCAVPVPGDEPVHFYPAGDKPLLFSADHFRPANSVAPSAVLVEATYKGPAVDGGPDVVQVRKACSLVGAPAFQTAPSAFILNFPQGAPPQFGSIAGMLAGVRFLKPGQWQQTIGANVPGDGSLGPLAEDPGDMMPSDALAMTFYHWLRYAGCEVDPASVVALVDQPWGQAKVSPGDTADDSSSRNQASDSSIVINSCLVRETGARQYAILNQTGPGGAGQDAISNAFSSGTGDDVRPQSALPLWVDVYGNVNLPERRGFDSELVSRFFADLHATNLAGIESQSTARTLVQQADSRIKQLDRSIILNTERLSSIRQRRDRTVGDAGAPALVAKQRQLLDDQVIALEEGISAAANEKRKFMKVLELAQIVGVNGEKATSKSFDICARMSRLASSGLEPAGGAGNTYLLGKRWLFTPQVKPISDMEILAVASGEGPQGNPWLNRQFSVLEETHGELSSSKPEERGLSGSQNLPQPALPMVVMLDSEGLKAGRPARLKRFRRSPYSNVGIPLGQLFYYAEDTLQSGGNVKLLWSVVARDLVAFRVGPQAGECQPSSESGWCRQSDMPEAICPGLACEVQVCAPLPQVPDFQTDIYLSNPTNTETTSLVPPVPSKLI